MKKKGNMPNIKPNEIVEEIKEVLENINRNNQETKPFVTAYQILEELPHDLKNRIIKERGRPGKDSGTYYSAASVVSDAAEMLANIEIRTINTIHLKIKCEGYQIIDAGNPNVGLYRIISK